MEACKRGWRGPGAARAGLAGLAVAFCVAACSPGREPAGSGPARTPSSKGVPASSPAAFENQPRADRGDGTYINPILAGEYPDPSICRVGSDYYLTHTPGRGVPGLLVWHSRDLVNWRPLGPALRGSFGDVWAPDFIHYRGLFYIYFPALVPDGRGGSRRTNFVTTAADPAGPWSDPVDLNVGGIDPGHSADADGNRFLYLSGGFMVPLTPDGLRTSGEPRKAYDGWIYPADWNTECLCLESPKLFFRDGFHYLVSAEGGTAGPSTSHMIVVARSGSPEGPWENSPLNPLLRTRSRSEKWWSQGHGTIFEAADGSWHVVYHAYEKDFRTLGRMTLLMPVEWTADGWPRIPDGARPDGPLRAPAGGEDVGHGLALSDDFRGQGPGLQWRNADPAGSGAGIRTSDGALWIPARGTDAAGAALLTCLPPNHAYEAEVEVRVPEGAEGGLLLHYSPARFGGVALRKGEALTYVRSSPGDRTPFPGDRLRVRVRNVDHDVSFFWSADGRVWTKFEGGAEMSGYHHDGQDGWGTLKIALFAAGRGEVEFRDFRYQGLDESGRRP